MNLKRDVPLRAFIHHREIRARGWPWTILAFISCASLAAAEAAAPITIPFTLEKEGYVTLVVEDASGKRVRNLVSETLFPAGRNEVRWDGLDAKKGERVEKGWQTRQRLPWALAVWRWR